MLLSVFDLPLWNLPWWNYVLITLVLTHITIASVTIFLHRHQAHRALDLHPAVSHFFRFWLWMTTGMVTKAWAAIHRKHHAKWTASGEDQRGNLIRSSTYMWVSWGGVHQLAAGEQRPHRPGGRPAPVPRGRQGEGAHPASLPGPG